MMLPLAFSALQDELVKNAEKILDYMAQNFELEEVASTDPNLAALISFIQGENRDLPFEMADRKYMEACPNSAEKEKRARHGTYAALYGEHFDEAVIYAEHTRDWKFGEEVLRLSQYGSFELSELVRNKACKLSFMTRRGSGDYPRACALWIGAERDNSYRNMAICELTFTGEHIWDMFVLTHVKFPKEAKIRRLAEKMLSSSVCEAFKDSSADQRIIPLIVVAAITLRLRFWKEVVKAQKRFEFNFIDKFEKLLGTNKLCEVTGFRLRPSPPASVNAESEEEEEEDACSNGLSDTSDVNSSQVVETKESEELLTEDVTCEESSVIDTNEEPVIEDDGDSACVTDKTQEASENEECVENEATEESRAVARYWAESEQIASVRRTDPSQVPGEKSEEYHSSPREWTKKTKKNRGGGNH